MTDRKAFLTLARCTGKDFDDWHFKMKQFLGSEAEFLSHMMWVDQQAAHVSEEELAQWINRKAWSYTKWLDQQLYRVLTLNFDGLAVAVAKNLAQEAKTQGVNAWVEITEDDLGAHGPANGWLGSLGCSTRSGLATTPMPCSPLQVGRVSSDSLNLEERPL